MKIGIFDSGIGGINVLNEAVRQLPGADFIYYADCGNAPYGTKTPDEVRRLTFRVADFLVGHGAEALLVACNTATSAAVRRLRLKYDFPIVGMEPAVKPALTYARSLGKRVIVTATELTVRGEKLNSLIHSLDGAGWVSMLPLQELVELAERLQFTGDAPEQYLRERLSTLHIDEYCALVLGCTHFNYFADTLQSVLPENIRLFDGNEGAVNHLVDLLGGSEAVTGSGYLELFDTGVNIVGSSCEQKYRKLLERMPLLYERVFR